MAEHIEYELPEDLKELRSNVGQVEMFKNSPAWKDMLTMLDGRIEVKRNEMETCMDIEALRMVQGEVSELKIFKEFPDLLIQEITLRQEHIDKNRKQEEISHA